MCMAALSDADDSDDGDVDDGFDDGDYGHLAQRLDIAYLTFRRTVHSNISEECGVHLGVMSAAARSHVDDIWM